MMRGGHHIKSWSTTQKKITLSSGEAELAACVKTSCERIGILQMAADWGRKVEGKVMVDTSAAISLEDSTQHTVAPAHNDKEYFKKGKESDPRNSG